jgi:protein TonB
MFDQSLLDSRNGRRKWSFAVSTAAQCLLLGLMILAPMLFTEAGPKLMRQVTIGALPGPPPKEAGPARPAPRPRHQTRSEFAGGRLQALVKTPDSIYTPSEPEEPFPETGGLRTPGVKGGTGGPGPGFIGELGVRPAPTPPAPPAPAPEPPRRIKVGHLDPAQILSRPQPAYPPLAKAARIQGVVKLEAIISKSGTIENLQIISGHRLLVEAAVQAVRQWRYRPTILNGEPVEVITTIEVHFTLSP